MIISDDTIVSKNWDTQLINFIGEKRIIVSGMGMCKLKKDGNFYYKIDSSYSPDFLLSQLIDRNFIFSSNAVMQSVSYPYEMKYNGEELALSLNAYIKGIDIYSSPSDTYHDLEQRTLDNLYVPFSKDHNYNKLINSLKTSNTEKTNRSSEEFLKFHNINKEDINLLPYENNDVAYDPTNLEYQDMDHRKFIENINGIF